jgi:HEAT repeat protein
VTVMSDPELLSLYRQAALEEAAAAAIGDHRSALRHGGTVTRIYRELRERGPEATGSLLALLDDLHPRVRASAAAHALDFAPVKGEEILCELVALGGPAGAAAGQALADWRAGVPRYR